MLINPFDPEGHEREGCREDRLSRPARDATENAMLPLIAERRSQIADICRRFGVRRLAVFGSAARGQDFDPERSDVDFLVAFEPPQGPSLGDYLALRDALAAAVGRPVDL